MEYKIIFEEVVQHEFYVTADSLDDVQGEFELAASQSEFDFSDGDVVMSQIVRATDESGNTSKFGDSYSDLEEKCLRLDSEEKKTIMFNIFTISPTMCRIVANDIRSEIRAIADGGCICDLEVMLSAMQNIKKACAKKGYEAVFDIM